jgi:hypothetical protein
MNKTFLECGLINFSEATLCRRCSSISMETGAVFKKQISENRIPFTVPSPLSIIKYFFYAILIEIVAIGVVANYVLGSLMRHSAAARRPGDEIFSMIAGFILHLPTILITYFLSLITESPIVVFTPITQVIFWVWFFAYMGHRRRVKAERRAVRP